MQPQISPEPAALQPSPFPPLAITRVFDASVERLFASFSTPDAIQAWWWPVDLHADRVDLDFREGGRYFINMKGGDWTGGMTGVFESIVPNRRLVMSDRFADGDGRPVSAKEAGLQGDWPETLFITLEFEAVQDRVSRLHLVQQGIPREMHEDCIRGWSESFDKLDRYLASTSTH